MITQNYGDINMNVNNVIIMNGKIRTEIQGPEGISTKIILPKENYDIVYTSGCTKKLDYMLSFSSTSIFPSIILSNYSTFPTPSPCPLNDTTVRHLKAK